MAKRGLPCEKCSIAEGCGFDGEIQNVEGEKLRKQYFTLFLLLQTFGLYMVYIMLIENTLINGTVAKLEYLLYWIKRIETEREKLK